MLVFNYYKAMAQVSELRQIASDMTNMNNRNLAEAISCLQSGWQGQTAQQFLKKCSDLKELIEKEAANIRKVADSLERTARTVEVAERAAAEAANRLERTVRTVEVAERAAAEVANSLEGTVEAAECAAVETAARKVEAASATASK